MRRQLQNKLQHETSFNTLQIRKRKSPKLFPSLKDGRKIVVRPGSGRVALPLLLRVRIVFGVVHMLGVADLALRTARAESKACTSKCTSLLMIFLCMCVCMWSCILLRIYICVCIYIYTMSIYECTCVLSITYMYTHLYVHTQCVALRIKQ